jgi:uncharacterized BrkB/YihY/UPF0761 family membrane protein
MEQTKAYTEHEARGVFTTTIQSTLLLFFTLFPLMFMYALIHEGAHALSGLSHREVIRLFYAHPFARMGMSILISFLLRRSGVMHRDMLYHS